MEWNRVGLSVSVPLFPDVRQISQMITASALQSALTSCSQDFLVRMRILKEVRNVSPRRFSDRWNENLHSTPVDRGPRTSLRERKPNPRKLLQNGSLWSYSFCSRANWFPAYTCLLSCVLHGSLHYLLSPSSSSDQSSSHSRYMNKSKVICFV